MTELKNYTEEYKQLTIRRIVEFFGFHASLINGNEELSDKHFQQAAKTLHDWIAGSHELYMIIQDSDNVGFLHICYRGEIAAWIEDVFVEQFCRGRGVASRAIGLAEDRIKAKPGCRAVCMDVVPRNEAAMRLYHRLGYDSLSLITLRKELYDNKRDRTETILGLDFKV